MNVVCEACGTEYAIEWGGETCCPKCGRDAYRDAEAIISFGGGEG